METLYRGIYGDIITTPTALLLLNRNNVATEKVLLFLSCFPFSLVSGTSSRLATCVQGKCSGRNNGGDYLAR